MTTLSRRTFLAASLAASGAALALPRRLFQATYFPWEQIRPGFWAAVSPAQGGNVLAVKGTDGSLLIDSKFAGMAATLRREASDRAGAVRALLNTHHHGDHTGGNLAFHGDVETYAHAAAIDRIKAAFEQYLGQVRGAERQVIGGGEVTEEVRAELEALLERESDLNADLWVPRYDIARVFAVDQRAESLGKPEELIPGVALVAHHFGAGHTDNDLAVFFPDADVLHTGDLCFNGRHPFFDPTGGATVRGWIKSLEGMLANCTDDTIVIPGHGAIGDKAIIQKQIDYMNNLASAVEKELVAGRTRDEVLAMSWPFMDGLADQGRTRAIGAVYDELQGERGSR